MKTGKTVSNSPLREDVAHRAHIIWEERGRPEGHDVEIWLEAERQLINERNYTHATGNTQKRRDRSNAADTIDEEKLDNRLNDFGEPASRSPTSLDLT